MKLANRERLKDGLVALSLANLLMVRAWGFLLNPANQYFLAQPPGADGVLVTIAGTLVAAALLFVLVRWAREARPITQRFARASVVLVLLIGLNGARQLHPALSANSVVAHLGVVASLILGAGGIAIAAAALLLWGLAGIARGARRTALALTPVVLVTFGTAVLAITRKEPPAAYLDQKPAARVPSSDGVRLLFIVFDGLDQDILFTHRPPDLEAPAFDRLLRSSVSWDNAYPPANSTVVSLPALITGRTLTRVERIAPNDLLLSETDPARSVRWSREDTLFARAHALGADSALIGWYHPYCRVLGSEVEYCRWWPYFQPGGISPLKRTGELLATIADTVPGVYRLRVERYLGGSSMDVAVDPAWHAQLYTQVHDAAVRTVAGGGFRFVFVHYPIPHEPFIYDRRSRRVGFRDASSYLDNVALADRALAELLDAVDRSGRSAQTAIIVTADHGLRRPGWRQRGEFLPTIGNPLQRVPLIVRLPGQEQADVRHETVRTVRTHDAAVAILKGLATRPDKVAAILAASGD